MALQARGEPARRGQRRLRRLVAAGRGQQRVHARRVPGEIHVLSERARMLPGDRGHDVARPVRAQLGAQDDRPARQVAAQPRRAPHDLARVELVGLGPQLLQEGAAQVLLDLLLGLLDRHLGQRRDRGEVEELRRLGRHGAARLAEQEHAADDLVARRDRNLGEHARRHLRRAVLGPVADVAAQDAEVDPRPRAAHGRAEPRHDDGHGGAGRVGGELGHATQPVAAEHGVHHLEMYRPQPLDERAVAPGFQRLRSGHLAPYPTGSVSATPGCACSVSSPDSPVRMR